jgi:hypothetical protein
MFLADPLALSLLSLPDGRWRTVARAHHQAASRYTRVPIFAASRFREVYHLRFLISGNAEGFALSFPKAE